MHHSLFDVLLEPRTGLTLCATYWERKPVPIREPEAGCEGPPRRRRGPKGASQEGADQEGADQEGPREGAA